ncbi:hypothetical protein O9K51_08196 [Purpureocillium lavendulum]|uniref:Zn(2)-C6 fungal-type domain-containing protein n=1 Tax=Purpureocillium lavendulum TaxID=1247861 RepID=A0AB34FKJ6_9HYPO|nr:hypothetical protein O9K51_08196 [Purpureocillium lavendulum]
MASMSASMALRESFGDRKIPEISRKITACVSCRKLKVRSPVRPGPAATSIDGAIKCHMSSNKPPCMGCRARGVKCTINRSLQSLLESDASWKESMEERLSRLERFLPVPTSSSSARPALPSQAHHQPSPASVKDTALDPDRSPDASDSAQSPQTTTLNLSCSLGAFPASSMTNNSVSRAAASVHRFDFISQQLVPLEVAEFLFAFYQRNLDHYVHNILAGVDCVSAIRERSSLLLVAICTAAAFCSGSIYYPSLLKVLREDATAKVFASHYDFDDVRALCIGALWLPEVSASLNGLGEMVALADALTVSLTDVAAVRIATELDLHRCIIKMPHAKRDCYDRTRLYFLVYLCDHHCSLSHGKLPLTRDFQLLKSPRTFLETEFALPSDQRLISQVELWSIFNRVFDLFGADVDCCIAMQRLAEISSLDDLYEQWYSEWSAILQFGRRGDNSSSRHIFDLYYHCAKLYLFSHVFRGQTREDLELDSEPSASSPNSFARRALEHALCVVCIVTNEPRDRLQNLPCYIGAVIAFASVCLVKAASQNSQAVCGTDEEDIVTHLRHLVKALQPSVHGSQSGHPLLGIAKSLDAVMMGTQQFDHERHMAQDLNALLGFDLALDGLDVFGGGLEQTGVFSLFDS